MAGPPPQRRARGDAQRTLLGLVARSPGLNKTALVARSGYAWGTVSYHLAKLERAGRVVVLRGRKEVAIFPPGLHANRMRWLSVLQKPEVQQILGLFQGARELTIPRVVADAHLSRRMASDRLRELVQAGITEPRGSGRPRFALNEATWRVVRTLVELAAESA